MSFKEYRYGYSFAELTKENQTPCLDLKDKNTFKVPIKKLKIKEIIKPRSNLYHNFKNWNNRLIQGDSLEVMTSLLENENMKNKIQTIYMDPPYGINYNSTFVTRNRKVKAYDDKWDNSLFKFLIHIKKRLLLFKKLLKETGSCFVQISHVNLHFIKCLMEEIFCKENYVSIIVFRTKSGLGGNHLVSICDYIIWFAKNKKKLKTNKLFVDRDLIINKSFNYIEEPDGTRRIATKKEIICKENKLFRVSDIQSPFKRTLKSSDFNKILSKSIIINNKKFKCGDNKQWKTNQQGFQKLEKLNRISTLTKTPKYIRYFDDFPMQEISNIWLDNCGSNEKVYAVQTPNKIIERCILMSSNTNDLIFDPTCGGGTTAVCSEKYGRRWITCDNSKVAIDVTLKRLKDYEFNNYKLRDKIIENGFIYKEINHIKMRDIIRGNKNCKETLFDQPVLKNKHKRVTGNFNLEYLKIN